MKVTPLQSAMIAALSTPKTYDELKEAIAYRGHDRGFLQAATRALDKGLLDVDHGDGVWRYSATPFGRSCAGIKPIALNLPSRHAAG